MDRLTRESFWEVFDRTMNEDQGVGKVGYEYYKGNDGRPKAKVLLTKDRSFKASKGKGNEEISKISSSRPPRPGEETKEVSAIASILKDRNEFNKVASKDDDMPDAVVKPSGDAMIYFDGNDDTSKPNDKISNAAIEKKINEERVVSSSEVPAAYFVRTNDDYNPEMDYFVCVSEDDEYSDDLVAILVDNFNSCCLFQTEGDGVYWAKQAGLKEGEYDILPYEGDLEIDNAIPNSMPLGGHEFGESSKAQRERIAKRCLKEAETPKKPGKFKVISKDKIKEALESAEKRLEKYVDLCTKADNELRPKWALANVVCARQSTEKDKNECKYYDGQKNGIVTLVTIPYDKVDERLTDDLVPVGFLIEYFAQEGNPSRKFDEIVKEKGGWPMLRKYNLLPITYDVSKRDNMPGSSHEENMRMLAWKFIDSYTDIEDPMELIEDKDDSPVAIDDNWNDVIDLYD